MALLLAAAWLVWSIVRAFPNPANLPNLTQATAAAWSFLLLTLAVAGLSMAFLQIGRTLLPVRGWFHRAALRSWLTLPEAVLGELSGTAEGADLRQKGLLDPDAALGEFEAHSRSSGELYNLPIEQLCGQLTLAFEAAMDKPSRFPALLIALSGAGGVKDLLRLLRTLDRRGESAVMMQAEARSALTRLSQIRIDRFQISAGGTWRRALQMTVVLTSILLSIALTAGFWQARYAPGYLLYAVLAGLAASYLAMLLRDLAAIVELKRRQT